MRMTRHIVKRWFAGVLAVSMLSTISSTTAFAVQENVANTEPRTVAEWAWADQKSLVWEEETGAWVLSLTCSEEKALDQAALEELLPDAVVIPAEEQTSAAEEETVKEETTPAGEEGAESGVTETLSTPVPDSVETDSSAQSEAVTSSPASTPSEEASAEVEPEEGERADTAKAKAAPVDGEEPSGEATEPETENVTTTEKTEETENGTDEEKADTENEETLPLTWKYDTLTLPLQTGSYTLQASLPDGYVLAESAAALQVTLEVAAPAAETTEDESVEEAPAASNDIALLANGNRFNVNNPGTVDTVSPVGTTINLFNYWVTDSGDPAEDDNPDTSDQTFNYDEQPKQGINKDHALKFTMGVNNQPQASDFYKVISKANVWTGNKIPYSDIVLKQLKDGYPQLNETTMRDRLSYTKGSGWNQQTLYPDYESTVNYGESLKYLFDNSKQDGKESWQNVKGLLQIGKTGTVNEGYYYYDATENFAEFNENTNSFKVYDSAAVTGTGHGQIQGQFFPFNTYQEAQGKNSDASILNHYFGMTMTTRFVQMEGGRTEQGQPVTYEFSGDDDVWVFIDDVLVGDLGGIHDKASLKIDFQTGNVYINATDNSGYQRPTTTIKAAFEQARKKVPDSYWKENTFADNTYHTLKFFYLERGNNESNMSLKFNLVSIPQSDLIKVDQTGDPIQGAEFELYAATKKEDGSYQQTGNAPIATGITDGDGSFVFTNTDGTLLSLNDLKENKNCTCFILKEISVPAGYRSSGDIYIYFPDDIDQPILLSDNYWETGAYAMPMVTATLPDDPQVATQSSVKPNNGDQSQGTYFAVVFAKDGDQWYPVSGDPLQGWTIEKPAEGQNLTLDNIIQVAQKNQYTFELDSSGSYKATIVNLPGDIKKYYHILLSNYSGDIGDAATYAAANAQYTIAYYYTNQDSLDQANASNTVRLNSDIIDNSNASYFERDFAVRLYVPNIKNYILVQKVDANGNPITNGTATFELYTDEQVTDQNGVVTINGSEQPYDTATTSKLDNDIIKLDAAAVFPTNGKALPSDTYYLRELSAPNGYAASDDWTKIVVDESGVYANAGTDTDDITVLRGAGNIVRSMVQFAVPDHIDQTLTDIQVELLTKDNFTDKDWVKDTESESLSLTYNTDDNGSILDYKAKENSNLYFSVKSGWSKVQISQSYTEGDKYKTKLKEGTNLTNLFSRSTIIQVKNYPTGLTISKSVSSSLPSDKTVPFTIQITADDSIANQVDGKQFDYVGGVISADSVEQKNSAPNNSKVTFTDGKTTIQLMDNQTITIQNLPYGTYTVQEIDGQNYNLNDYTVSCDPINGQATLSGDNSSASIAVTNTRKATGKFSLQKLVTGDFGDKTKYFAFNLELKNGASAVNGQFPVVGTYAVLENEKFTEQTDGTLTFDSNGKVTIYLKDKNKITVNGLPLGATCTISEPKVSGYTTHVTGGTIGTGTDTEANTSVQLTEEGADVVFTNNCTLSPPTGLHGETGAYQLMLSMAVLAAGAGWAVMRRRKNREEE